MTNGPSAEMPKYKCHKEVHALKIGSYEWTGQNTLVIRPRPDTLVPITIGPYKSGPFERISKEDTGYYVVYEGGYVSWSPTAAFEDGYTRI